MQSTQSDVNNSKDLYFYASILILVAILGIWFTSLVFELGGAGVYWIAGIAFGVTVQRSRFCFTSAFRDYFLLGQTRILKGILVGLVVASVGFAMIMSTVVPNPDFGSPPSDANLLPVGLSTILAGSLFGVGMVLAGGCVSGSLYRMGEGYVASWVVILGVMVGLFFLNNTWNWWWDNLISTESNIWLPEYLSYSGSILVTLISILFILYLAVRKERKINAGFVMPVITKKFSEPHITSTLGEIFSYFKKPFNTEWNPILAGVILAFINILLFIKFHPFGVVGEISRWSTDISQVIGFPELELRGLEGLGACVMIVTEGSWFTEGFFFNVGIIAGSAASSILSREFKVRIPKSPRRYIQSLIGGIIMGYGAGLGVGCTLGAFFSAIPSLALNGWVYGAGLCVGAYLGVQIIKRFP